MTDLKPRPSFRTLAAACRFEIDRIKGSRFIADGRPVTDEESARAVIDEMRAETPGATHHCWAYCLHDGGRSKFSDDGEPGGSAGRPILAQINGHDLLDVVVVVTRFFGGTKLGVGGLVRAYGGAAGKLLDRAEIRTITPKRQLKIEHAYSDAARIEASLAELGLAPTGSEYSDRVTAVVWVPDADWVPVRQRLVDLTSGRIRFDDEVEPGGA